MLCSCILAPPPGFPDLLKTNVYIPFISGCFFFLTRLISLWKRSHGPPHTDILVFLMNNLSWSRYIWREMERTHYISKEVFWFTNRFLSGSRLSRNSLSFCFFWYIYIFDNVHIQKLISFKLISAQGLNSWTHSPDGDYLNGRCMCGG